MNVHGVTPGVVRGIGRRVRRWLHAEHDVSADYRVLTAGASADLSDGWRNSRIVERQDAAFAPLLEDLRNGHPRQDFRALAEAVRDTGLSDPLIVEVGCATGWNLEVLTILRGGQVRYLGIDYSPAMLTRARRSHPSVPFLAGDAVKLPLRDGACEVLISGGVLMHVADYRQAIVESRRVARQWVVFHTIPVLSRRSTTLLSKRAYGQAVVEVVFNEQELLALFGSSGLRVRGEYENVPYDLEPVLGETTRNVTYLCEVHSR